MNTKTTRRTKGVTMLLTALMICFVSLEADARIPLLRSIQWTRQAKTAQKMTVPQSAGRAHSAFRTPRLERYPATTKYLIAGATALAAYYPSRDHIWGPVPAAATESRSPSNPIHRVYNGLEWGAMVFMLLLGVYLFWRCCRLSRKWRTWKGGE